MSSSYYLKLKPEYEEKYNHSENPINIGIETEWNTYSVSSVDKNTGEYTIVDPVYVDVGYLDANYIEYLVTSTSSLHPNDSSMKELNNMCYLASPDFQCIEKSSGAMSYHLPLNNFEDYYVYVEMPSFKIVNVSGTLSLYK